MNLESLGNLGEFIGGIAVIVTLTYLAFQVRQGTKTLRANSVHELTENILRASATLLEPENAACRQTQRCRPQRPRFAASSASRSLSSPGHWRCGLSQN